MSPISAEQIAETLRNLDSPRDFVTQPYSEGVDILDIQRSAGQGTEWTAFCTHSLDLFLGLLDTHEPGAVLHARRTTEYTVRLARFMALDDEQVEVGRLCAAYHDIGKIGIPDHILQKPAPLSPAEKDVVNRHSEIGYQLLSSFPFLIETAEAVRAHHERFDGRGYPLGLAGARIPLASRVVAVADTFDALRFSRFYHDASPLESTVREIQANAGLQFDPEVVAAFSTCYRDLDGIFPHMPAAERLS